MAYLSVVDIKHATSAVDQLTVTGLLRYGQVASLRRLQVVQFRYGAPVIRSLFVTRTHPHMSEFTWRRSIIRSKYNTRKRKTKLSYCMTLWENLVETRKNTMKPRKEFFFLTKLFLENTEDMFAGEQSVTGNGRSYTSVKMEKKQYQERKQIQKEEEHLLFLSIFPMGLCNQLRVLNAQDISLPAAGSNIK